MTHGFYWHTTRTRLAQGDQKQPKKELFFTPIDTRFDTPNDTQISPENLAGTLTQQVTKNSFGHLVSLLPYLSPTSNVITASACSLTSNFSTQKSSVL